MSKITNVRLPNASPSYSPEQFDQLVRSLEQVILQLNTAYTPVTSQNSAGAATWMSAGSGAGGGFAGGIRGFQLSNGMTQPHAMLISDADQINAGITSENLVTFNTVALSNGVRVVDNTKIFVPCSGQYLVTFTLQMTNRSNTASEIEIWAKDTGINFALSGTRFDIPARKTALVWSHIVPAITGIFTVNDPALNYLEIAWWADNIDVYLQHYPAGVSPTRPEIPSVILTINFVSAG